MSTEHEEWDTCQECQGEGYMEVPRPFPDDPYFCVVLQCRLCGGSGWMLRTAIAKAEGK
jgi:DnaJ-class molecular chaperone